MDDKIFDLITKMYSEVQGMNEKFHKLHKDITSFKTDLTKIVIGQEKIQTDIKIIVEVQKSHVEENGKHHGEIVEMLIERVDIAELAIRKISSVK